MLILRNSCNYKYQPRIKGLIVFMLMMIAPLAYGQNTIKVEKFELLPNDQSALSTDKLDNNGKKPALIIIEDVDDDVKLMFDLGASWSKVEDKKVGNKRTYYVWVSEGARRMRIYSPDKAIGECNYNFNTRIERAKTYKMDLSKVFSGATISGGSTYLTIKVDPPTATVEVDGVPWQVKNGIAENVISFGNHTYNVSAVDYYPDAAKITINQAGNQEVSVRLKPNFGWLQITGDSEVSGADIYVDGQLMGTGKIKTKPIKSGEHVLKVTKDHYEMYEQKITIYDDQTSTVTPKLESKFATTTLVVDPDVEIWLDQKNLGKGKWTGPIDKGDHFVECRRAGHTTTQQKITIDDINRPHTITLDAPQPIFGTLTIESEPRGARVYIDGESMGVTPYHTTTLLVGTHKIRLEATDSRYQPYEQTVSIRENDPQRINASLTTITSTTIYTKPSYASITLDGKWRSDLKSPVVVTGPAGETHTIEVSAWECNTVKKTFTLGKEKDFTIKLHHEWVSGSHMYVEGGGMAGGMLGAYGTLGAFIKHFNFEATYYYAADTEEISWMPTFGDVNNVYTVHTKYKPSLNIGGAIGVNLNIAGRVRITPQIGAIYHKIMAETDGGTWYDYYDEDGNYQYIEVNGPVGDTYCVSGTAALNLYFAFSKYFGIHITPTYQTKLMSGDGYNFLRDHSSKIKGWGEGFVIKLGFSI